MIKNDSIFNIFSTHSKAKNKTMVLISSADENDYTNVWINAQKTLSI